MRVRHPSSNSINNKAVFGGKLGTGLLNMELLTSVAKERDNVLFKECNMYIKICSQNFE